MTSGGNKAFRTGASKLLLSAIFGVVGGLFAIAVIGGLDFILTHIWSNWLGYNLNDPKRGIVQLVVLLIVGLIIGLLAKRYGPNVGNIESVISDSLEHGKINWKMAFKNVGIGILSISSGASLGPEAPAAMISGGVASVTAEKLKLNKENSQIINISAVSGMLGALLSSPFVATSMFMEFSKQKINELRSIVSYTFVAGSFGIATFFILFNKLFASSFGIPKLAGGPTIYDLLMAFVFGIIGAIFAVLVGLVMRRLEPFFKKLDKKLILRSVVGAAVAGIIAVIFPITMFSGQHTMATIITQAASYSALVLFLTALTKLFATATLIRTGFFGGPIFPTFFSGAALGLAVNTFFHSPVAVAVSATIAGIMIISLQKPLSAALITTAIAGVADATVIALAVSAGLVVLVAVERRAKSIKA